MNDHLKQSFLFLILLIHSTSTGQSKKEQLEILTLQRDSLLRISALKDQEISTLSKENIHASAELKALKSENENLLKKIEAIENRLNEALMKGNCPSAKTETTIILSDSGEEPSLEKRTLFQGFEFVNYNHPDNSTYPNRSYVFEYFLTDVCCSKDIANKSLPASVLFNEQKVELENKINRIAREQFLKRKIPNENILTYSFGNDPSNPKISDIHFFIEWDHVTFFLEQYHLGINDRLELSFELKEIAPYLNDLSNFSIIDKHKYCSERSLPILVELFIDKVTHGDMSTYVDFIDPITNEIYTFDQWSWQDQNIMLDEFVDQWWRGKPEPKNRFLIQLEWSKVMQYKYVNADIGSIETGNYLEKHVVINAKIAP